MTPDATRGVSLPASDDEIRSLPASTRETLTTLWEQRAQSELGAASGFALVVQGLFELGTDVDVLELATQAVTDEVRHAKVCHHLASAYRGHAVPLVKPKRVHMPTHGGVQGPLLIHLHVVGLCCINESIATAFVSACLEEAKAPLVHAAHHQHLADEVQHARVGWAHLASVTVDDEIRDGLRAHLRGTLSANRKLWHRRIDELPEHGVPRHAYPPRQRLHQVVDEAIRDLVLPGFALVGLALPAGDGRC